jgi:hypothetical protein
LVLGLAWVVFTSDHAFFPETAGTGASVLLLFPGLAAAALAAPARHSLAATLQYPLRLLIWWLAAVCFAVAMASCLRIEGWCNIAIWALATVIAASAAVMMGHRAKALRGAHTLDMVHRGHGQG